MADGDDVPQPSPAPIVQVATGRYLLTLGLPSGTLVVCREPPADVEDEPDLRTDAPPDMLAAVEREIDAAKRQADAATKAVRVSEQIASGAVFEPDFLLARYADLLAGCERLVGDGRHADALRVARAVHGAAAVALSWWRLLLMLRRLWDAVSARRPRTPVEAEQARALEAWVAHERGTLALAGRSTAEAERWLRLAQRLAPAPGHPTAVAARQNLALVNSRCGWRRPLWQRAGAVLALLVLLAGGVAAGYAADDEPAGITTTTTTRATTVVTETEPTTVTTTTTATETRTETGTVTETTVQSVTVTETEVTTVVTTVITTVTDGGGPD